MRRLSVSGSRGAGDDQARLVTTDPKIAQKYGLVDESEYWEPGAEDDAPEDTP